ncbi:hypothetical protein CsSME_00046052 [Camellia sinensis var. sinensis]
MPISKLAEIEKQSSAAEKRPTEAGSSEEPSSKKPRLRGIAHPGIFHTDKPWTLTVMVGDRPLLTKDSTLDNMEVSATLSIVVLLPADHNRMTELTEYENYALMMEHYILAIQQGHSFAVKIEEFKKELTKKTKEAAKFLTSLNWVEARIRSLLD